MNILKNKYLSNSIWLILEKIVLMLMSFAVGVFVVRYLGKEEYGFYSYIISLFLIFEVFCTFGQNNIIVKEIVKFKERRDKILGTAFRFQLVAGLICFFCVIFILGFYEYDKTSWCKYIVVFFALPVKSFRVISFYFDAELLGKNNAIIRTSVVVIVNTLKILIIFFKAPFIYFYVIILIDAIFYSVLYLYYYKKQKLNFYNWKFDITLLKPFFRTGMSLMLASFLITIYLRVDQIMITNILNAEENGLYAAAIRVSSSWYSIGWAAILSLFPALIKYRETSNEIFKERLMYLIQAMLFVGFGIGLFFGFLSEEIIEFLFTEKFARSATPLKVHIWSSILIFIYFIQEKWYVISNKEFLFFISCSIGLMINCILNFLTLKTYGINAAAYNTLIGLFFSLIIFPVFFKETREIFLIQIKSIVTLYKFGFLKILNFKK